jgi:ParB family transcriptional regulator, chromosome partitioning protein
MTTIQTIPLDKLYPSPANARKTGTKDGIEALAESIHVHGLLNNLVVQSGGEKGTFSVLAGQRRLAALNHLAKAKKLESDYAVPCNVIEIEGDISSEEISLAENEMRAAMHPADQFEAFKKLADERQGPDTIAAKFGVTPRVVEQRLRLARVSPKLIKAYRDDEMSLEQLMAFSVSTDQKQQEKVWKELPKWAKDQRREDPITRAITEKHIPSDNDIALFVGIEAYEAAGGQVLRDLFTEEGRNAYLANAGLLDKLAAEKLEQIAETVRAEGWKWVAVVPDLSWDEERKYTKRDPKRTATAEEKAEAAKLRKQLAILEKKRDDLDEDNGEFDDEIDALTDKVFEAEQGTEQWTAKDKEAGGVIVTIENGKALIKRGMMKADEARAAKKARATKSKEKGKSDSDDKGLSGALVESLTSQRTAEIQAKVIDNPKTALVGVVQALIQTVTGGYNDCPFQIRGERERLRDQDAAKSPAAKQVDEALKKLKQSVPSNPEKLWEWLSKKDQKALLDILAICAAATFDAVHMREYNPRGKDVAGLVAEAVKLDMAKVWEPTAGNYFERVSAAQIIAAVAEACGKAETQALVGMKKGELAKAAERKIKGKGWLPEILRGAK